MALDIEVAHLARTLNKFDSTRFTKDVLSGLGERIPRYGVLLEDVESLRRAVLDKERALALSTQAETPTDGSEQQKRSLNAIRTECMKLKLDMKATKQSLKKCMDNARTVNAKTSDAEAEFGALNVLHNNIETGIPAFDIYCKVLEEKTGWDISQTTRAAQMASLEQTDTKLSAQLLEIQRYKRENMSLNDAEALEQSAERITLDLEVTRKSKVYADVRYKHAQARNALLVLKVNTANANADILHKAAMESDADLTAQQFRLNQQLNLDANQLQELENATAVQQQISQWKLTNQNANTKEAEAETETKKLEERLQTAQVLLVKANQELEEEKNAVSKGKLHAINILQSWKMDATNEADLLESAFNVQKLVHERAKLHTQTVREKETEVRSEITRLQTLGLGRNLDLDMEALRAHITSLQAKKKEVDQKLMLIQTALAKKAMEFQNHMLLVNIMKTNLTQKYAAYVVQHIAVTPSLNDLRVALGVPQLRENCRCLNMVQPTNSPVAWIAEKKSVFSRPYIDVYTHILPQARFAGQYLQSWEHIKTNVRRRGLIGELSAARIKDELRLLKMSMRHWENGGVDERRALCHAAIFPKPSKYEKEFIPENLFDTFEGQVEFRSMGITKAPNYDAPAAKAALEDALHKETEFYDRFQIPRRHYHFEENEYQREWVTDPSKVILDEMGPEPTADSHVRSIRSARLSDTDMQPVPTIDSPAAFFEATGMMLVTNTKYEWIRNCMPFCQIHIPASVNAKESLRVQTPDEMKKTTEGYKAVLDIAAYSETTMLSDVEHRRKAMFDGGTKLWNGSIEAHVAEYAANQRLNIDYVHKVMLEMMIHTFRSAHRLYILQDEPILYLFAQRTDEDLVAARNLFNLGIFNIASYNEGIYTPVQLVMRDSSDPTDLMAKLIVQGLNRFIPTQLTMQALSLVPQMLHARNKTDDEVFRTWVYTQNQQAIDQTIECQENAKLYLTGMSPDKVLLLNKMFPHAYSFKPIERLSYWPVHG